MCQSPLIGSNWESCVMPDIFQQVNTDYKSGPGSLGIKFPPESPVVCSWIRTRSSRGWDTPRYGVKRSSAHAHALYVRGKLFLHCLQRGGWHKKTHLSVHMVSHSWLSVLMWLQTPAGTSTARMGVRLTLSSEKDRGGHPDISEESGCTVISRHSSQWSRYVTAFLISVPATQLTSVSPSSCLRVTQPLRFRESTTVTGRERAAFLRWRKGSRFCCRRWAMSASRLCDDGGRIRTERLSGGRRGCECDRRKSVCVCDITVMSTERHQEDLSRNTAAQGLETLVWSAYLFMLCSLNTFALWVNHL